MSDRPPQDSAGRPIAVGDRVRWRGEIYTIKAFGDPTGRYGTRTISFEESLHITDEVPDEIGVDRVEFDFACLDCGENGFGYHVCPRSPEFTP